LNTLPLSHVAVVQGTPSLYTNKIETPSEVQVTTSACEGVELTAARNGVIWNLLQPSISFDCWQWSQSSRRELRVQHWG
jgi:hypothetical protein